MTTRASVKDSKVYGNDVKFYMHFSPSILSVKQLSHTYTVTVVLSTAMRMQIADCSPCSLTVLVGLLFGTACERMREGAYQLLSWGYGGW